LRPSDPQALNATATSAATSVSGANLLFTPFIASGG
jgi:hypothetical protein